ncbi:hypothetical protein D5S18_07655 [Nocardia panacis]|uniref:Tyr recombinase domain-containing protein n=1 Tax=Nocardia panacis TaxID=2340916 RepID=A0A3A4KPA0_9NOCA|nr:tyrosine-type recombinase/integrase [Nocardia panacis]RJO77606.1 hypothetical protein D5S18_07655 [Nocardia panacis]
MGPYAVERHDEELEWHRAYQTLAYAAYLNNGEERKRAPIQVTAPDERSLDTKFGVVIGEWKWRQEELNPRRRSKTSLEVFMSEVFVPDSKKDADGKPIAGYNVVKIEDLRERTVRELSVPKLFIDHIDKILKSGMNAKAQRQRLILIEMMEIPMQWGVITTNPAEVVPDILDPVVKPKSLAEDGIAVVRERIQSWAAGDPRREQKLADMFDVGLALATRTGELLALLWEENDRDDGLIGGIHLDAVDANGDPAPYVWITGKIIQPKGEGPIRVPHTKTGEDGIRRVPIPLWAVPIFRRLRQEWLDSPLDNPLTLLFPSRNGTPRSDKNVNRSFRDARGEGLEWVSIGGTTRKTSATAIMRELGPEATAEQLGHTTTRNVKYYAVSPGRIVNNSNAAALESLAPKAGRRADTEVA